MIRIMIFNKDSQKNDFQNGIFFWRFFNVFNFCLQQFFTSNFFSPSFLFLFLHHESKGKPISFLFFFFIFLLLLSFHCIFPFLCIFLFIYFTSTPSLHLLHKLNGESDNNNGVCKTVSYPCAIWRVRHRYPYQPYQTPVSRQKREVQVTQFKTSERQ